MCELQAKKKGKHPLPWSQQFKTFFSVLIGAARGTCGYIFLIYLAIVFKSYRAKFNIRKPINFIFQMLRKSSDFTGRPRLFFPLFFLSHVGYTRRNHQRIEIHSSRPSIKLLTTVIRKTVASGNALLSTSTVASPWSGFLRHNEIDNNWRHIQRGV